MIAFVPYRPEHLAALKLQEAQAALQPLLADPDYARALVVSELSWSGVVAGEIVGTAGLLPIWPGRAQAWALIGPVPRQAWGAITRHAAAVLRRAHAMGHVRIETTVDARFAAGVRWVRLLGFEPEGLMRHYTPEGRDHLMYARLG